MVHVPMLMEQVHQPPVHQNSFGLIKSNTKRGAVIPTLCQVPTLKRLQQRGFRRDRQGGWENLMHIMSLCYLFLVWIEDCFNVNFWTWIKQQLYWIMDPCNHIWSFRTEQWQAVIFWTNASSRRRWLGCFGRHLGAVTPGLYKLRTAWLWLMANRCTCPCLGKLRLME